MYDIITLTGELKKWLKPKRYAHSINVMDTARRLAEIHGEDVEKAAVAGLLHDCMRDLGEDETFLACEKYGVFVPEIEREQPVLLHGALGSAAIGDIFGVNDVEISEAIKWHTTGYENMSKLSKIVFISDFIEPGRDLEGIERVRDEAKADIDHAMLDILDNTILYIVKKRALMHPDTISARNDILNKINLRRG
jgi:predicted HD superfamily hydrolase involved in NAD metabolism